MENIKTSGMLLSFQLLYDKFNISDVYPWFNYQMHLKLKFPSWSVNFSS